MTCKKCPSEAIENSRRGLCRRCGKEADAEAARERARLQHRRRMEDGPARKRCACGCGEMCRSSKHSYLNAEHRDANQSKDRSEHKQPRVYKKVDPATKMQRVTVAEKREIVVPPVLQSTDEEMRHAELLERAQRNRLTLTLSRFEDGRETLWGGA